MKTSDAPIFIVGVGRSGTSLVHSMLAAHSNLAFPPETSFLRRLIASGIITKSLKYEFDNDNLPLLDSDRWIKRTNLNSKELLAHAREEGVITGGSLYRALLFLYAKQLSKPRCGDKDPRSIEYLEIITQTLPGVMVIHVIRDPRDVLASKKKAAWSRKRGSLFHIFANRVQMRIGRTQGPKLLAQNYHELIYEDLIADPEVVLRHLCLQLDLSFEYKMLEFNRSAKKLVSESELSWKKETLGPLLKDNHGKWKQSLSDWEIALTEMVCVDAFNAGSYKKDGRFKQMNLIQQIGVYLAAAVICILDPIYRQYRRWTVWRARRDV